MLSDRQELGKQRLIAWATVATSKGEETVLKKAKHREPDMSDFESASEPDDSSLVSRAVRGPSEWAKKKRRREEKTEI